MIFYRHSVYLSFFLVFLTGAACGTKGSADKAPPQPPANTGANEAPEEIPTAPPTETPADGRAESPEDAAKRQQIFEKYAGYEASELKEVPVILPEEAFALYEKGLAVFVDTREPSERQVSMLPGAVTTAELSANMAGYVDKVIIPYCTIGYRSGFSTLELLAQFSDVRNLKGSVLLWSHSGLPFFKEGVETKQVHVYAEDWNLLASGYVAVY